MTNSPRPSILITGVTGHVGFQTLLYALRAGYTVRAAVRSQAKADAILSHAQIRSLHPGSRLAMIIIPDMALTTAFTEAVRGIDYIIHIASPLVTGKVAPADYEKHFVRPAVYGTLGVLNAAKKAGSVRRVVLTSSIVALMTVSELEGHEHRESPVRPTDRVPLNPGPYASEFEAYHASKVAALATAEAWVRRRQPGFDVVYLHPSFIQGRNDFASSVRDVLSGTNAVTLGIALGQRVGPFPGASVHLHDVARVHVQALEPRIPGNTSYILSQEICWNDVKEIVKKEFPTSVMDRLLPNNGSAVTIDLDVDTSLTEAFFGFKYISFEEQVKSILCHYLEVKAKGSLAAPPCSQAEVKKLPISSLRTKPSNVK